MISEKSRPLITAALCIHVKSKLQRFGVVWALVFSLLFSLAVSVIAQTKMDTKRIEMLAKGSDAVVVARTVASHSYWLPDSSAIATKLTFQITKSLLGQVPSTFSITIRGGEVGEIGMKVSSQPNLKKNMEYLLFLKNDNIGYRIYKGNGGVYLLKKNKNILDSTKAILQRSDWRKSNGH